MFTERMGAIELLSRPEGRVALAGTLLAFLQVWPSLKKMLGTGLTQTMDKTKKHSSSIYIPVPQNSLLELPWFTFLGTKRIGRNLDG